MCVWSAASGVSFFIALSVILPQIGPAACHSSIGFEALDLLTAGIPPGRPKKNKEIKKEAELQKHVNKISEAMKTKEIINTK